MDPNSLEAHTRCVTCYCYRSMKGKVMETETIYHNYGCSHSGTIAGVNFSEEYKKVDPNISGYYIYESGVSLPSFCCCCSSLLNTDRIEGRHEVV